MSQETSPCVPPWENGPTRLIGKGVWGIGAWYDWYLCPTCSIDGSEGAWRWNKNNPGYETSEGQHYCNACGQNLNKVEWSTNIPAEYRAATLSDYKRPVESILRNWPKKLPFLMLQGIPGAGKTRACWAIIKAMSPTFVRYVDGPTLRQSLMGDAREGALSALCAAKLLILDDISATTATPGWIEFIHALIDARTVNLKPMIITAACGKEELGRKFDGAIESRLKHFAVVIVGDQDRRTRGVT